MHFTKMNHFKNYILVFLLCKITIVLSQRSSAKSIAEQLGYGVKRVLYYLESLVEECDVIEDINKWILMMDSYLKCTEKSYPEKLKELDQEDSLGRLSELCAAWPRRKGCSSRLASKLDSCLGSSLEDGGAGTNGLRLAEAHMNFICHHKHEYAKTLDPHGKYGEIVGAEKRVLSCYKETETQLKECIATGERDQASSSQMTFCKYFDLAKMCLLKTSRELCSHQRSNHFLKSMLGQLSLELQCESDVGNEIY